MSDVPLTVATSQICRSRLLLRTLRDRIHQVTKPARHNQRSIKRLLEANGWTETVGGKHVVKMTKPGHRPITLPHDKSGGGYPIGLAMAILRQAGLKGGDE
jgi:predicted RNA binding protein YcfA (HicA-like mRNA interferase family)